MKRQWNEPPGIREKLNSCGVRVVRVECYNGRYKALVRHSPYHHATLRQRMEHAGLRLIRMGCHKQYWLTFEPIDEPGRVGEVA
jgi:hypothetical protein